MEVLPVVSCSPRRLESVLQWPAVGLSLKTRGKINRDLFSHNICRPEHDHENEADKDSVNTYVIHHNFQVNS